MSQQLPLLDTLTREEFDCVAAKYRAVKWNLARKAAEGSIQDAEWQPRDRIADLTRELGPPIGGALTHRQRHDLVLRLFGKQAPGDLVYRDAIQALTYKFTRQDDMALALHKAVQPATSVYRVQIEVEYALSILLESNYAVYVATEADHVYMWEWLAAWRLRQLFKYRNRVTFRTMGSHSWLPRVAYYVWPLRKQLEQYAKRDSQAMRYSGLYDRLARRMGRDIADHIARFVSAFVPRRGPALQHARAPA